MPRRLDDSPMPVIGSESSRPNTPRAARPLPAVVASRLGAFTDERGSIKVIGTPCIAVLQLGVLVGEVPRTLRRCCASTDSRRTWLIARSLTTDMEPDAKNDCS